MSASRHMTKTPESDTRRDPIQHKQGTATTDVMAAAEHGLTGGGGGLPFAERIQHSFGRHSVAGVVAHTGGAARQANESMGSMGYATGNHVAFRGAPDLHTAAHEAAHVIQQRAGVSLKGGVGESGDRYERHADAVAERVVQGKSAEDLLDQFAGGSAGHSVQRRGVQHRHVQFDPVPGQAPGPLWPGTLRRPDVGGGYSIPTRPIRLSELYTTPDSMLAEVGRQSMVPDATPAASSTPQISGTDSAASDAASRDEAARRGPREIKYYLVASALGRLPQLQEYAQRVRTAVNLGEVPSLVFYIMGAVGMVATRNTVNGVPIYGGLSASVTFHPSQGYPGLSSEEDVRLRGSWQATITVDLLELGRRRRNSSENNGIETP